MIGTAFIMILYFVSGVVAGLLLSLLINSQKQIKIINQCLDLLYQHSEEQDPEQRLKIAVQYAFLCGDTDLLYANLDSVMFIREAEFWKDMKEKYYDNPIDMGGER